MTRLAFRAARGHAASEDALELQERTRRVHRRRDRRADPIAAALHDLGSHVADRSFVRSFAYATGPAYGVLLDRYDPAWRTRIRDVRSLALMLARAVGDSPDGRDAADRAARYDGVALRADETARGVRHDAELSRYRLALVDGPTVTLAFRHMKIQFDPREPESLDELGTVYPKLRVSDDWRRTRGQSRRAHSRQLDCGRGRRPGGDAAGGTVRGDGWTLTLAPGFSHSSRAGRDGDLRARCASSVIAHTTMMDGANRVLREPAMTRASRLLHGAHSARCGEAVLHAPRPPGIPIACRASSRRQARAKVDGN